MKNCENCGGKLTIDAVNNNLICEYCGYKEELPKEITLRKVEDSPVSVKKKSYYCEKCKMDFLIDSDAFKRFCPYCGEEVYDSHEIETVTDGIILYRIKENEANEKLVKGLIKRAFAPKELKKQLDIKVKKVYIPSNYFYAKTLTNYTAAYETTHTTTDSKGRSRTRTSRSTYSGTLNLTHNHFVETSGAVDRQFNKLLNSYNAQDIVPFFDDSTSLASAEISCEPFEVSLTKANNLVYNDIIREMSSAHFGCMVSHTETINKLENKYCNTFLPTYFVDYTYKNKSYTNILNAVNGKLYGKKPLSVWKILSLVGGILLVLCIILFLIYGVK